MSTLVRKLVNPGLAGKRSTHVLSNGNLAMVIQDGTTFFVYRTTDTTGETGWVLDQSFFSDVYSDNSFGYFVTGMRAWSSAIDAQDNLYLGWFSRDTNGNIGISHRKILFQGGKYSTIGAREDAFAANSNYVAGDMDIDVTDTGVAIIGFTFWVRNVATYARYAVRDKNTGGWAQPTDQVVAAQTASNGAFAFTSKVSITALDMANNQRNFVMVVSHCRLWSGGSNGSTDDGAVLYSGQFDESNFAHRKWNQRAQFCVGYIASYGLVQGSAELARDLIIFRIPGTLHGFIIGVQHNVTGSADTKGMAVWMPGTWDGSSWSVNAGSFQTDVNQNPLQAENTLSFSVGIDGTMNFYRACVQSDYIRVGVSTLKRSGASAYSIGGDEYIGKDTWWDAAATTSIWISSGSNRNVTADVHPTKIFYSQNSEIRYHGARKPKQILTVTPEGDVVVPSATPTVNTSVQAEVYWSQSYYKMEIQFCPEASFATGVRTYTQGNDKYVNVTGSSDNPLAMTDTIPISQALPAGYWYMRVRLVDAMNRKGDWTAVKRFIIGHPPVATPLSPLDNQKYEYGENGTRTFSWQFSDSSASDSQTAYQFRLKAESGTMIYDTGKVNTSGKSVTYNVPIAYLNQTLYWDVRLWDTDDAAGQYSTGSSYFSLVQAANATIVNPLDGSTISTGVPTVRAQMSTTGDRKVKEWVWIISQAGSVVWSSKRFFGTVSNGGTVETIVPNGVLKNNAMYSLQIQIVDDAQLSSNSPASTFHTLWVSPAVPSNVSVDTSHYNDDDDSYIRISWDPSVAEIGFTSWGIYRRDDIIDPVTKNIYQAGVSKEVGRVYSGQGSEFRDYLAPSGVRTTYAVRQQVTRANGFLVESENEVSAAAVPQTDGYWIIDMSDRDNPETTKLHLVVADSFTDEDEEAEFIIIGRGRHVDKGESLGPKGTLDIQVRHTGGIPARAKRLKLLEIQRRKHAVYLRNPFGDVFLVSTSSMSVGRLAGVGVSEFCDVTIPYSEVG
jgi:hypothetical protein